MTTDLRNPTVQYGQEIRLAIVMYGGVSLAIYINGIAQELLHLVRATAPADPTNLIGGAPLVSAPSGTEAVYRKLGQMLSNGADPRTVESIKKDAPILTRFVIDSISGTSAGGINGIFLGKALANEQSIEALQDLWVSAADIATLINDQNSITGTGLTLQNPPASLLNGQRMYLELVQAFRRMDQDHPVAKGNRSRYGDDLDVFVTTTDVRGAEIALRLADKVVTERRHRNVFHLRYRGRAADARNDFGAADNPFLAFTARCTSSFPFAFEPMHHEEAKAVLATDPNADEAKDWSRFFRQSIVQATRPTADASEANGAAADPNAPADDRRAFGDGGFLDNKPFSYAVDVLSGRRSRLPVERKLFYVEPDPEHSVREAVAKDPATNGERPDALETAMAALTGIPRYETIREDLQRILERNQLISRVNHILVGLEQDIPAQKDGRFSSRLIVPSSTFGSKGLDEQIGQYGLSYGGYHRLKVAALTDDLAVMIARTSHFDVDSDEFLAVRRLVVAWRDSRYAHRIEEQTAGRGGDSRQNATQKKTFNEFLLDFDIPFRLRRLAFVHKKADALGCIGANGKLAKQAVDALTVADPQQKISADVDSTSLSVYERVIREITKELDDIESALASAWRRVLNAPENGPVSQAVSALRIGSAELHDILDAGDEEKQRAKAEGILRDESRSGALDELASQLATDLRKLTEGAAKRIGELLDIAGYAGAVAATSSKATESEEGRFRAAIQSALRFYYLGYESYDAVAYPILYSTGVGEELTQIDVIRISPEDATRLVDQTEERRPKLAGISYGHFGGFLNAEWRRNDILWGRLDGAERLIEALLPGAARANERRTLIDEAHQAILTEVFGEQDRERLHGLLFEATMSATPKAADEQSRRRALEAGFKAALDSRKESDRQNAFVSAMRSTLNPAQLRTYFAETYAAKPELEPEMMLETASRSTRVVGEILEQVARHRGLSGAPGAHIARLGSWFWGLVSVAVPGSTRRLLLGHWLKVLYLLELLLIVGGTFIYQPVQHFGLLAFGITFGVHVIVALLGDLISHGGRWKVVAIVVGLIVAVLAAVGGVALTRGIRCMGSGGPAQLRHVGPVWIAFGDTSSNVSPKPGCARSPGE